MPKQATRAGHQDMRVTIDTRSGARTVVTDAERLRTALVNILTNARHAVAARRVRRRRRRSAGHQSHDRRHRHHDAPRTGSFRITVRDRGVGVKPEDLPRVFDPYFTTKRTGSGLGLAIAKNIIEGMGGSIALESRPGERHRNPHRSAVRETAPTSARRCSMTREAARSCSSTTSRRSGARSARRCAPRGTTCSRPAAFARRSACWPSAASTC